MGNHPAITGRTVVLDPMSPEEAATVPTVTRLRTLVGNATRLRIAVRQVSGVWDGLCAVGAPVVDLGIGDLLVTTEKCAALAEVITEATARPGRTFLDCVLDVIERKERNRG